MDQVMTERIACKWGGRGELLLLAAAISIPVLSAHSQVNAAQTGSAAHADDTAAKTPVYDVISIKPNQSGYESVTAHFNNDSYSATNISLKRLLQDAYGVEEELIFGVPVTIDSERFDISAKIIDPDSDALTKVSEQNRRSMLLPFLAEHFKLKTHIETKTLPVYELIIIQGGPTFVQTPDSSGHGFGMSVNNNRELAAHDLPMKSLAKILTDQLQHTVIDKTGLTGTYDLALKWSTDDSPGRLSDSGPSVFTALQQQPGVKLQPGIDPVQTLIVDHVELPSEN
jgi:uncharacterized protein (TIGR03435 family)